LLSFLCLFIRCGESGAIISSNLFSVLCLSLLRLPHCVLVLLMVSLKSLEFYSFSLFTFLLLRLDILLLDPSREFSFQLLYFSVPDLPYVSFR
jgi:hypothetical protein